MSTFLRRQLTRSLLSGAVVASQLVLVAPSEARADVSCTIAWDGGADSPSWSALANWSLDRMPTSSDIACIGAAYAPDGVVFDASVPQVVAGLSSAVPLTVAAGDTGGLTVAGDAAAPALALESGALVLDGRFTTGDVDQRGGALAGAGVLIAATSYRWETGSIGLVGGLDIGGATDVGEGGFAIVGDQPHFFDTGTAVSWVGYQFDPRTSVVIADDAVMIAAGGVSGAAPGVVVDGAGRFQVDAPFDLADGDDVTIRAALVGEQGSFALLGSAGLTLAGSNDFGGDVSIADAEGRLLIGGSTHLGVGSSITGAGRVDLGGGAVVTADGEIDVPEIRADDAALVAGGVVVADFVSLVDSSLEVRPGAAANLTRLGAQGSTLIGAVDVAGDAVLADVRVVDDSDTPEPTRLFVAGPVSLGGDLLIEDADVRAADITVSVADGGPGDISLLGAEATLDVTGTFRSTGADRISQAEGAAGTVSIHDLRVDGGSLDVEPLLIVEEDDAVTVAKDALLRLTDAVLDGPVVADGPVELRGEVSISGDVALGADSQLLVGPDSRVQVLGGTVGGQEASVVNLGWLAAAGTLVGIVENGGVFGPAGTLGISGSFTQSSSGRLVVDSDAEGLGLVAVSGTAELAGTLQVVLPNPAPTKDVMILAADSVSGSFNVVEGLGECNDVWLTAVEVVLTVQPCITMAPASVGEDIGVAVLVVTLDEPLEEPLELVPSIVPGEAGVDDYVDVSGDSIVIPAGETTGSIGIEIVDDDVEEGAETFTVDVEGVGVHSRGPATVTIVDNDLTLEYGLHVFGPADGSGITGVGSDVAVGVSETSDGLDGWVHSLVGGSFRPTPGFVPAAINSRGLAVGVCAGVPCVSVDGATQLLATDPDARAVVTPVAVSENDVIVGTVLLADGVTQRAVRWSGPSAPLEVLPGLSGLPGATSNVATDVTASGVVVGATTVPGGARGWVQLADDTVVELPSIPGHPYLLPQAANDLGLVVGFAHDGSVAGRVGFFWTEDGEMHTLPEHSELRDVNPSGDAVGAIGDRAVLVREGEVVELDPSLAPAWDGHVVQAVEINPDGVVAVTGRAADGTRVLGVLVPPGSGCRVCLDASFVEPQFPDPQSMVDVGDELVEGNRAEFQFTARNRDTDPHTVTFAVIGPDGQPISADITETLGGSAEGVVHVVDWNSEGAAWRDPQHPGEVGFTVEVRDENGTVVAAQEFRTLVVPRPVVTVHGMNSNAATWDAYDDFIASAHPGWRHFSIDTMDTSSFVPNTIAENAALLDSYLQQVQRTTNAWQVDVVAHSMGGLISRYYIDRLMTQRDGEDGVRQIRRLVMLGTPNEGSPCAALLPVPMTAELRPDVAAAFNATVVDRRGVVFSLAAGDPLPFTCQSAVEGDQVVPVSSARWTLEDVEVFDILHTDMTGSSFLFEAFVLPRLIGGDLPSGLATAQVAETPAAAVAAPGVEGSSPQLLGRDMLDIAPGDEYVTQLPVPAGVGALGVTVLDAPSAEIVLERAGAVVVTSGTDRTAGSDFRTVRAGSPAAGTWTIRVVNHGAESLSTTMSTWVTDPASRLVATMRQVSITGDVEVTAHVEGDDSIVLPATMQATAVDGRGATVVTDLTDDGLGSDDVAGDGVFAGVFPRRPVGPLSVEIWAGLPFNRMTTAALVVAVGADGPGDDAPVALDGAVRVRRDEVGTIELQAGDPEGGLVTYEIVAAPEHGVLGGEAPQLTYLPAAGFTGDDRFTFRVSDGSQWSTVATVRIAVGRGASSIVITSPSERVAARGSTVVARVAVRGPRGVLVAGGSVEFRLGDQRVEVPVVDGAAETSFVADLPDGQHDLVAAYSGDRDHEPSAALFSILVVEGVAPEAFMEPVVGEAGYPSRFRVTFADPDHDVTRVDIDYTDDGIYDVSVTPQFPSAAIVDRVVEEAGTTPVRARVVDSAGHETEVVSSVTMAPYRPLGALSRVLLDGQAARQFGVSDDGRYVLVQDGDNEGGTPHEDPLVVVDRVTGAIEPASVLDDGTVVWITPYALLSPNGRMVAFGRHESVGGYLSVQTYVRDLDRGVTTRVSNGLDGQGAEFTGTRPLAVTDDGHVLFLSRSINLTNVDIRRCSRPYDDGSGLRDRCMQLYMASPSSAPVLLSTPVDGLVRDVVDATMSFDGRMVAFTSTGDYDHLDDATTRVLDLGSGKTEILVVPDISTDPHAVASTVVSWMAADGGSYVVEMRDDVLPGDTNGFYDLAHVDRATGTLTVLTADATGRPVGGARGSTDRSGVRTAFWSVADELDRNGGDGQIDVFVTDLVTGRTVQADVEARDGLTPDGPSGTFPRLSGNGQFVVFDSTATNLVPGDIEEQPDTFVLDLGPVTVPPPPNHRPTAVLTVPADGSEGALVPVGVAVSDVDGDPLTLTWSASGGTLNVAPDGLSGSMLLPDGPASVMVSVTVDDGRGTADSVVVTTATIEVANAAPTVTITQPAPGLSVEIGVDVDVAATTADAGGDPVSCSIGWGDGSAATQGCSGRHRWTSAGTFTVTVTAVDDDGATAVTTRTVTVVAPPPPPTTCSFGGFQPPVSGSPTVNVVEAGSVVPVKFQYCSDGRLTIFAPGSPWSSPHQCGVPLPAGSTAAQTPGASRLSYDRATGRYHYNWQTSRDWAGQCRTLVLRFSDGSEVRAEFRFTKPARCRHHLHRS